jgi:hypothetical protein
MRSVEYLPQIALLVAAGGLIFAKYRSAASSAILSTLPDCFPIEAKSSIINSQWHRPTLSPAH